MGSLVLFPETAGFILTKPETPNPLLLRAWTARKPRCAWWVCRKKLVLKMAVWREAVEEDGAGRRNPIGICVVGMRGRQREGIWKCTEVETCRCLSSLPLSPFFLFLFALPATEQMD
ncbi:hypothetical protein ACFX15_011139 [Malus domestica]